MTDYQTQSYISRIKDRKFYFGVKEKRNALEYYATLIVCCMLFGLNIYMDYVLTAVFCLAFLFAFKHNYFIFTYVALIFFESKLAIPDFSASILRIVTLFYIFRMISNSNVVIETQQWRYTLGLTAIYVLLNILDILNIVSFLSLITNVLNILVMAFEDYNYNEEEKQEAKQLFLLVIACFAMMSGMYGFYNGKTLPYGGFKRYCGTIDDPNYSALMYCFGFASLYGVERIKPIWKIILFLGLTIDILFTVSMSGIATVFVITIIWLMIKMPLRALCLLFFGAIFGVIFLKLPFKEGDIFYGLQSRVINILAQISSGDFSSVTSGRTDIAMAYMQEFNSFSLKNKLFGGFDTLSGEYRDYMVGKVGSVAHNSYIDILFKHGIFGLVLLIGGMLLRTLKIISDYFKKREDNLAFALQKIVLMIFAFTLSIYPYRYFIFFMLI